ESEIQRFCALLEPIPKVRLALDLHLGQKENPSGPFAHPAVEAFLKAIQAEHPGGLKTIGKSLTETRKNFDPAERQKRQLQQLVDHTQQVLQRSAETRREFWSKANT